MSMDATYGVAHRYFAQALLSQPVRTQEELKVLYRSSYERAGLDAPGLDYLKEFVKTVNGELRTLELELAKGRSERDGHIDWALVSTAGDELTAAYPKQQLCYMQAVVRDIVTSARGQISSTTALNLCDGLQPHVSIEKAQAWLQQLVDDRWLEMTDGWIALDTRAIIELKPYLKNHFGDHVSKCPICNHLAIRGIVCQQCDALAKHHAHCLHELSRKKVPAKCRECNALIGNQ